MALKLVVKFVDTSGPEVVAMVMPPSFQALPLETMQSKLVALSIHNLELGQAVGRCPSTAEQY